MGGDNMTLKDILGAIEDLTGYYEKPLSEVVYIKQPNGELVPMNGIDFNEDGRLIIL
jgi:hypothetical protein